MRGALGASLGPAPGPPPGPDPPCPSRGRGAEPTRGRGSHGVPGAGGVRRARPQAGASGNGLGLPAAARPPLKAPNASGWAAPCSAGERGALPAARSSAVSLGNAAGHLKPNGDLKAIGMPAHVCVAQHKEMLVRPAVQGTARTSPVCFSRCGEHTGEGRPGTACAPTAASPTPSRTASAPFPRHFLLGTLPGRHGQIPSARR